MGLASAGKNRHIQSGSDQCSLHTVGPVDSGLCQALLYTDDVSLLERKYKYHHYIISINKGVFICLSMGDAHTISIETDAKVI
jgi:hypothetical protein